MGNKEKLQKELDFLLEKLRFWRYVILGIVSGTVGIVVSASQHKLELNNAIVMILLLGLFGVVVAIKRIDALTKEYQGLLEILEKEE